MSTRQISILRVVPVLVRVARPAMASERGWLRVAMAAMPLITIVSTRFSLVCIIELFVVTFVVSTRVNAIPSPVALILGHVVPSTASS